MYHGEEPTTGSHGGKSLKQRLAEIHPELHIEARMDSYSGGPMGDDHDYMKERHARLKKEIAAFDDEIENWNAEEVAARALKSLKADLAGKRADLMKVEADMDAADVEYEGKAEGAEDEDEDGDEKDGETVAEGNPYSVMKRGGSYVLENTETGHVKGRHKSKAKAMRQFRLLEGIEHGWKPTGKPAKM